MVQRTVLKDGEIEEKLQVSSPVQSSHSYYCCMCQWLRNRPFSVFVNITSVVYFQMQQLLERNNNDKKQMLPSAVLKSKKESFASTTMDVEGDGIGSKKSDCEDEDYGNGELMEEDEEEVNKNSKKKSSSSQKINNLVFTSDGVLVVSGAFVEVIILPFYR